MTDKSAPFALLQFPVRRARPPVRTEIADDTALLLELASQLGPRDALALAAIVRRAAEISETEGEEVALAVLDQIEDILKGRVSNA
jgi:hypothetical protein